jgi:tetratricopeptide (TPR) repeat protein
MKTRWQAWLVIGLAAIALPAAPCARAATPDPAPVAEQARLEAGADLGSRAQRVLFRARDRQDQGAFAEAAALVEQWLAGGDGRDHHLLRFNLAVSLLVLERPAEALANLEKAVGLAPRYARAWLRLGEAAYAVQNQARAGEAFARAYELGPERQPEILYYAGVSQLGAGQPERALDSLAQAIDAAPDQADPEWYRALVAAAVAAKRPARAAPYLQRLLTARPSDPAVWDLAYRFHAGQSEYEQAAAYLTVVGYLRPLARAEQAQLGDLYAAIGVPMQAARYYEKAFNAAAEPRPDDYRKLAGAWLAAHELDAARSTLRTALAALPTRELWALQGDLEYMAEQYAPALEAFARAAEMDPGFGRAHLMLGTCAVALGREDEARRHLQRAAGFPDQRDAALALGAQLDAP